MFKMIQIIWQSIVTFVKLLLIPAQLHRAIAFLITVFTVLLTLLSAIEPIFRRPLPPPPPEEKPAVAEAGYLVVDMVDNCQYSEIWQLHSALEKLHGDDCFHFTSESTRDECLGRIWVTNLHAAQNILDTMSFVEAAEPIITYQLSSWPNGQPNDPMYDLQWNMKAVNAPYTWKHSPRGKGVIVAVLDTGVTVVEDLKGTKVLSGASFTGEPQKDGHGHGTHVSGTIAQTTNNKIGVTGIAPDATILPVKVLSNSGMGQSDWIAAGIDYAVDQNAKVINMSLGGSYSKVIHNAIKKAREAGVVVVAACGNSSRSGCDYPGGLEETIGVSATGKDGKLSYYSSYGKGVDIAAPGGSKTKDCLDCGITQNTIVRGKEVYEGWNGTSMATPHVAGAAAVLASMGLDADQIENTLLQTARGDGWSEEYGNGHLDLEAAVSSVGGTKVPIGARPFAAAAVIALLLSMLAGTSRNYNISMIVTAALVAGGMWWAPLLPVVGETWFIQMLGSPLIYWPSMLFDTPASGSPLWASVIPIGTFAYSLGYHWRIRAITTGLAIGIGVSLLVAAWAGTVTVWWLPAAAGTAWLVLNSLACGFVAMSLAGVQHIEESHVN